MPSTRKRGSLVLNFSPDRFTRSLMSWPASRSAFRVPSYSNLLPLPFPAAEQQHTRQRNFALRHNNRNVRSVFLPSHAERQNIRQGNLQQSEVEQARRRRRHRIPSAVERLQNHHARGIPYITVTHKP